MTKMKQHATLNKPRAHSQTVRSSAPHRARPGSTNPLENSQKPYTDFVIPPQVRYLDPPGTSHPTEAVRYRPTEAKREKARILGRDGDCSPS